MDAVQAPPDIHFNRGLIADPQAFARDAGAASWLYLCSEAFAEVEGGMSYADVQAAAPASVNIVAEPPRPLDMDLAREGIMTSRVASGTADLARRPPVSSFTDGLPGPADGLDAAIAVIDG